MTPPHTAFARQDTDGRMHGFPSGRPSLVCFIKEDCKTCNLVAPLLEAFQKAFADQADILIVGQSGAGNEVFRKRHALTVPVLDDGDCAVSYVWNFEVVPAVFWTDGAGRPLAHFEGFVREEWHDLAKKMSVVLGRGCDGIVWSDYPEWRPGCGSKHLDPDVNDRLKANAEDSPIRARRIDIGSSDDVSEFMYDQGFSDGLPLVPPTPERVMRMLTGTRRNPQEVVADVPPNMGPATIEKIAINAVMAGCKPEYLPVVIAAVEAICTDAFNIHGVTATTMGASPILVVSGPIRHKIGMNMKLGALGADNRANATIGRALRLVVRNVGGAKPNGVDRSTLGSPSKFTMCFAEWEEGSPWEPLHVERGFEEMDSVVTVFAMTSGPVQIVDQESRKPDEVAGSLGLGLEGVMLSKIHKMPTDALLVVCPEHVKTLTSEGPYPKARLRRRIQEVTERPLSDMVAGLTSGAGLPRSLASKMSIDQLGAPTSKFADDQYIHIVVAGSEAGKFSACFHGWVTGPTGSVAVSRKIETY